MANKITKQIFPWIRKHRLIIMLVVVLIVFPAVVVTGVYTTRYNANKINPRTVFSDTEVVMKSESYLKGRFDIDVYIKTMTLPKEKDDTLTGGQASIGIVATRIPGNLLTEEKIKVRFAFAANWVGYTSSVSSSRELTNGSESSVTISSLNEKWPKNPILFVKVDHPDLLVFLEWKEKANSSSSAETLTRKIVLTYSYDQYITDDTIFN